MPTLLALAKTKSPAHGTRSHMSPLFLQADLDPDRAAPA